MTMRGFALWSGMLLFLGAEPASAQYIGEFGGWEVSKSDVGCSAHMEFEGPGDTQVTILKFASSGIGVLVNNFNWSAKADETYQVNFALNGMSYSGDVTGSRVSGRSGFVATLSNGFEDDFAKGSSLRIYLGEQQIDHLSLSGTAVAMQAVNRCLVKVRAEIAAAERERARYAHLPTDPFALPPPPPPVPGDPQPRNIESWALRIQNDYPSAALRDGASGTVSFTVTVSSFGRGSACNVFESSGHSVLDEAACSGVMRYARFIPAQDEQGKEIEGEWSGRIRYSLPVAETPAQ